MLNFNSKKLFINIHTHQQIHDAKIEIVNAYLNSSNDFNLCSYGIHPWYINEKTISDDLQKLELITTEKRCIAIGECGLDKLSSVDFKLQEKIFIEHINIANKVKKPIIVHCVKSFNELLNHLRLTENKMPVIIHGFNNNQNIAELISNYGFYFSFGKALLGYESNASKVIKTISGKRFFLESDDADISIKYIYKKAAEILNLDEDIIKEQIKLNTQTIFGNKLIAL
ncbi:MAG: TatD family hydrolase [Bacteroidetes bacterium]|nr:TatD family hydrolase [Bacteroidota bacterium]